MGLFGGKDKKGKGKGRGKEDQDETSDSRRSTNRKSRRIAAPSQGGQAAGGANTRRTSRRIQTPSQPTAPTAPLQLESGEDDVLDNSNLLEPTMTEQDDEILLSSSSSTKGSSVIGTSKVLDASISHSGDQPLLD
ncbi:MAG: hypothetical protein HRU15_05885, partial [Planctomycetes bacterium]|nr:hypothetical protein [Planctomycetota bacterium]